MSSLQGSLSATTDIPFALVPRERIEPGAVLGDRFRLEGEIGRGGMGAVHRAVDLETGALVAVKILGGGADQGPDAIRRFERECQIIANLRSAHVVRIIQRGALRSGRPYFAMELLRGATLYAEVNARGRVDVTTTLRWALQICDGVGEAHAAGVVHRDLKLDNIFLVQGEGGAYIKVLDFGIAKKRLDGGTLTGPAVMMGTPRFMAPEQFVDAREADARSDVWSIGVCLYKLLTGRYPFEAPNLVRFAEKISRTSAPSMRTFVPDLPEWLDEVVLECLATAPSKRFADARELATALDREEHDPFVVLTPPSFHRESVTRIWAAKAQEPETVCERPPTKRASGPAFPGASSR